MKSNFDRATLTLSSDLASVASISVYLREGQNFSVDPNKDVEAENSGDVIQLGSHARPFTVTGCKPWWFLFRVATLNMNVNAVSDWQSNFTRGIPVLVKMLLANNTTENLSLDLRVAQQSPVPFQALHAFVRGALYFAIAVVTLRAFKRSKDIDELEDAAHSQGH